MEPQSQKEKRKREKQTGSVRVYRVSRKIVSSRSVSGIPSQMDKLIEKRTRAGWVLVDQEEVGKDRYRLTFVYYGDGIYYERSFLLALTLLSLIVSCWLIFAGITQDEITVGTDDVWYDCSRTIMPASPGWLVVGLLLFGVNLYTLKITGGWRRWRDLRSYEKAVTAIPVATDLLVIFITCFASLLSFLAELCKAYSY